MVGDGSLTLREFTMGEPLPLAAIQEVILAFLKDREDVAVFGAQAVNAYVEPPRMTQDVDVLSPRAKEFAKELGDHLTAKLHIAVRIRTVAGGRGYRLYQVRKPVNRHLADVQVVDELPPTQQMGGLRIAAPAELVARKVLAYHRRRGQPKAGTDWRDLAALLLRFPDLKRARGPVHERLEALGADAEVHETWTRLAAEPIREPDEDSEFL